jgi:spermidine/putrescine transport system substrate-binding protein
MISRRTLMQMIGAGAGALGTPFGKKSKAFAAREKEMKILCWAGYNSGQVLNPFRKKEGATVNAESLTNDPTMINRLRAGETNVWDLINVNNPWARKVMWPAKLIKPLPRDQFEPYFVKMLPDFRAPYKWAMSDDGKELLGMAQRFGPYSFVVDIDKISRKTAEEQVGTCSTIPSSRAATVSRNLTTGTCSTSSSSRASIRSRSIPKTR